ncbi:hypothetical protein DdX_17573 [Ditylenchus destructor]|uniref:Uncharacterized protein n=1 Tax=Ditylenchus destructor TaxID=166010 RepID=A0AAD4MMT5_9BILA|nr:hypothetical protein DdX_17573 [Ditylenchus destructor]
MSPAAMLPVKIDLGSQEEDKKAILDDHISMVPCEKPDSYYRTLFGKVHVETAARYIAIALLIFQVAALFYANLFRIAYKLPSPSLGTVVLEVAMNAINVTVLVCVLVAQKKRIARLYWPFLIYKGLMIALFCTCVLVLAALFVFLQLNGELSSHSRVHPSHTAAVSVMMVAVGVGQLLLTCWMEMVVYKAYKFMINDQNGNTGYKQYQNQLFSEDPVKV